ncbi:MAG: AAA family ATPase [Zetaproteobacteria bacterium]|nr:MAG: AAA family ATPase [Zetaproteobacteria bacterium]
MLEGLVAGKEEEIRLVLLALIAGGHVLIEDVPGVGKTTLAEGLARAMGADFGRIQCTADMLPADIVGVEVFDPGKQAFVFHPGPIFHEIVLVDEINRATPKAQSALLEAMAERQVTIERRTYPLSERFFVIATQNPIEHTGVFALPEAQLDRFFVRFSLGYPDEAAERRMLLGEAGRERLDEVEPVLGWAEVEAARREALAGPPPERLVEYLLRLVRASRAHPSFKLGISPRAAKDLLKAVRVHAWLEGRVPAAADVQAVLAPCVAHRVIPAEGDAVAALAELVAEVPIPG